MKCAIIGAGLSGLSVAYFLTKNGILPTLFDPKGIAGGASGVAAGLLHPYKSKGLELHPNGVEGMKHTLELVRTMERFANLSFFQPEKILRFIDAKFEEVAIQKAKCKECEYLDAKQSKAQFGVEQPAILFHAGGILDVKSYLIFLYEWLKKRGAILKKEQITHIDELEDFDIIVIASGAWSGAIQGIEIQQRIVKGQLVVANPFFHGPPRMNGVYALNLNQKGIFGATYEHDFIHEEIEEMPVKNLLKNSRRLGIDPPQSYEIKSSLRSYGMEKGPIVRQLNDRVFALTGLGSRGMLLHALYAKKLAEQICNQRAAV